MSIRLAASKPLVQLRYSPARLRRMRLTRANDNASAAPKLAKPATPAIGPANGNVLHAALRHFAAHGLAAAQHAADEAMAARRAGDEAGYRWWHGICHSLDRRLAGELDQRAGDRERASAPR